MTTKIRLLHDTVGIPTGAVAVTQSASDNTTKVATTAYVTTALANLADSAPSTLNTLNELAAALGDDANFSTTVTNSIATKLPLAGGTLTGNLTLYSSAPVLAIKDGGTHGTNSTPYLEFRDGSSVQSTIGITNTAGDLSVWNSKNTNLRFATNNTEKMRIDSSGRVGLGSQITSNQASTYDARANDFVISGSGDTGMTIAGGGSENLRLQFTVNGDTGLNRGEINYDNNDNSFSFATAGSNRMGITSAGIVNINKPASGYGAGSNALNLYGDGEVFRLDGTGGASRSLRFRGVGTNGSSNAIIVSDGSLQLKNEDANAAMYFNSVRNMDFQVTSGNGTAGHMTFSSYNTEIMRIDGANNRVGIGDADPPSLLTVTGGNTGYVASNGAGISGIQVSRTTSSGENLYMYTSSGTGWSGSTHVGRVESYGNNAMEIGSQQNAVVSFGTNNTEIFRLRSDGLQFPDNNTFIATSNTAGGTAYEWGSIRRPAGSDGGQLSIRQYSTGDTAANYPAYAGGTSGWDENTGMFFYGTDEVGLTAAGNPTFWVEEGKKWEVYENGYTSGDSHRGQRVCLGGISHVASTNPGGSGSGTYLHIKTNVPKSNVMFRFEYKGYSYNDQNMDTSMVGYTYTGVSYVYSPTIENAGDTDFCFKNPYYSSDTKLVLVLKIANNYTGGILWAQFVGSHCMAPGSTAIVSTAYSSSTTGAF